jgi:hypothetical protein
MREMSETFSRATRRPFRIPSISSIVSVAASAASLVGFGKTTVLVVKEIVAGGRSVADLVTMLLSTSMTTLATEPTIVGSTMALSLMNLSRRRSLGSEAVKQSVNRIGFVCLLGKRGGDVVGWPTLLGLSLSPDQVVVSL